LPKSLNSPEADSPQPKTRKRKRKEQSTIDYTFWGKFTLFPILIFCLSFCSYFLLSYGKLPYSKGYFGSSERYYGLAGIIVALFSCIIGFALAFFIVWRVTVIITKNKVTVTKKGMLRSSKTKFFLRMTSFHFFRTSFNEEDAWLQFVVKEGNTYYLMFSWKGQGSQKERFYRFFVELQQELMKWKLRNNQEFFSLDGTKNNKNDEFVSTEIVSQKEINLLSPFARRLELLNVGRDDERDGNRFSKAAFATNSAMCIEDLNVINYDKFFKHFSRTKTV